MRALWELVVMVFLSLGLKTLGGMKPYTPFSEFNHCNCLSWRLAIETNNIRMWRTVPTECLHYVEYYMLGGQYQSDLETVMTQIYTYIGEVVSANSIGSDDVWVLDVDDTCISNLPYYQGKRYGCDPYDPMGFKAWALRGASPAISPVLKMFNKLVDSGFKVFLLTGRDEETFGLSTTENLRNQGFVKYDRLIMRNSSYKGQSAVKFKSEIRKQLIEQGYKIWGNVGDQWSDLVGDCLGERTFKLPNPMYFVP